MLLFLEIDFFRQYQHRQNQLLQNCLLNEPHHIGLLSVTSTNHEILGSLLNSSGTIDENKFGGEVEIQSGFESLCTTFKGKRNYYHLETLESKIWNFPSYAIIPSSNPDSPLPDHFCDLDFGHDKQTFGNDELIDLNNYYLDLKVKQIQETEPQGILEEIESTSKQDDLKIIPVSSSTLSKKLKPVRVSDPFLAKFEKQLDLLRCDREFSDNYAERKSNESSDEEIDQQPLSVENILEDNYLVEEPIYPYSFTNSEHDKKVELISAIRSGLTKIDITPDDDSNEKFIAVSSDVTSSIKRIDDLNIQKESSDIINDLDIICDSFDEQKTISLTLESPLHCYTFKPDIITLDSIRTSVEILPKQISPLSDRHFLSTSSKREIEMMLRDRDKTLDDMLSMTLRVPETHGLQRNTLIPFIREKYNLCNENMNCGLEVLLPWDPFLMLRNELFESKSILNSELKLCFKETVKNCLLDGDLKTIAPDEATESFSDDCQCEVSTEQEINCDTNKGGAGTFGKSLCTKGKIEAMSDSSMSRKLSQLQSLKIKDVTQSGKSTTQQLENGLKRKVLCNAISFDSPLDTFMLLRTGQKAHSDASNTSLPVAMVPPRSIIKAAKVKPLPVLKEESSIVKRNVTPMSSDGPEKAPIKSTPIKVSKQDNIIDADQESHTHPISHKKEREIIVLELPVEYQNIIDKLDKDSRPLLRFLKERKIISQDHQFCNMKPDITRFLLRQQEKRHENSTISAYEEDILKGVVCLHALVLSSDAVANYGILAAVGIIEVIREKHEFVGYLLESIRQYLIKEQHKADTKHRLHPKTDYILKMINESLCIPQTKVLILVRRYFDYCFTTLKATLSCLKNAVIVKYPSGTVEERPMLDLISKGNIIIAELSSELQFCPWSRINYIFEFEYREESEWFQLCFGENPNLKGFYALDSVPKKFSTAQGKDLSSTCQEATPNQTQPMKCFSEHIIIGSRRITQNQDLLLELENRLNITLIERDYSQLDDMFDNTEYYSRPDLIVDERTCIIIINGEEVKANTSKKIAQNRISSMKLKCLECYVILTFFGLDSNCSFPYNEIESLSQLLVASSQTKDTNLATKFHLLYAFSREETADWIFLICNETRSTSTVWDAQDWGNRFWLTEEMSLHEKFLLSFPCFTSFTAQIILTAAPLRKILGLTLEEMRNALKWLPDKIIEAFYASINEDNFKDVFPSASYMDRDIAGSNFASEDSNSIKFNLQQTQEAPDYDSHFVKVHGGQQCSSFPNIHEHMYDTRAPMFFPSKEREDQATRYMYPLPHHVNKAAMISGIIKEIPPAWNKDSTYVSAPQSSSTSVKQRPEDYLLVKQKDNVGMNLLHEEELLYNQLRQRKQQHVSPENHAPKWRLVECNDGGSRLSNNGVSMVRSQRLDWHGHPRPKKSCNKSIGTPSTVRLTPSKRRRLTFEKDPNSRDGQTRLSFV